MVSKIVRKSLLKTRPMIIGVAYIFLLSMVIISLALFVTGTMLKSYESYNTSSNFEDMQIYSNPALQQYDEQYMEEFAKEYNATYETYEAKRYTDNNGVLYVFSSYNPDSKINTIQVVEGELPVNEGEIFLTEAYATSMNKKVGDKIVIDGHELVVSGYGYIPIYTLPINFETFQFPGSTYMPAYINETTFKQIDVPPSNYIKTYLVDFKDNLSNAEIDTIANDVMNNYTVEVPSIDMHGNVEVNSSGEVITTQVPVFAQVVPAHNHTNLEALGTIVPTMRKLLLTFSVVVATLALVIAIVIFNAIFKSQRREIGILKAEGLQQKELEFHYTKFLALILLVSGFVGMIVGNLLARGLLILFASIYNLPILSIPFNMYLLVLSIWLFLVIFITIIVYIFAIRKNIKINIILLMKNIGKDRPPRFKLASKLTKLSFKRRVKINMTLRHLVVPLILFLGVFAVSFLMIMVQVMAGSMFGMIQRDPATINYDYQVTYTANEVGSENQDSYLSFMTQVIGAESENSAIQVTSFKKDNEKIVMYDINNNAIPKSDYTNGVVITYYTADKLNLKIGDTISVKNPFAVGEDIELKINNITNNTTKSAIYADIDYIQTLFKVDSNFVTGVYINESELETYKDQYPNAYYTSLAMAQTSTNNLNALLYVMISLVSIIASLVAFVSMFLISLVSINEHKKTAFIMRTYGYKNREINSMTNSINKWIILIAFVVTLPITWYVVTNLILNRIGIVIIFRFHPIYAIITLLFIYGVYYIASKLARRKIENANLAVELKNDE